MAPHAGLRVGGARDSCGLHVVAFLGVAASLVAGQVPGQTPSIVVLYSQSGSSQAAHSPQPLRPPALGGAVAQQSPVQNLLTVDGPRIPKNGQAGPAGPAGLAGPRNALAPPQTLVRADGNMLMRGSSPTPGCAGGQPFCLFDQEYPLQRVHEILNSYHEDANTLYHALHRYNPQEIINRDNVTHNYRHRGHFACESEVAYLRPGWARNWKDQWVTVVNTDKFPQMVRVETCKFLNQKCEFLPPCYKSLCVQRFAATRLLCVDPANPHQRPTIDVFEMPVACSCFVENFRFL